jgi:enhancing lycopene biosynthesis protein 2
LQKEAFFCSFLYLQAQVSPKWLKKKQISHNMVNYNGFFVLMQMEVVMSKIAVILSGCGVYDGAEVHESVLTMLYLDELQQDFVIMAPDDNMHHVINHNSGQEMAGESRNMLTEAARIARGPVLNIMDANPKDYSAAILPGGFGAAKNLCDFAFSGPKAQVREDIAKFLNGLIQDGKPIGALCISPVILALIAGHLQPKLTIGQNEETAAAINKLGAVHQNTAVSEICFDEKNNFVSTPAYMLGKSIAEIAPGIRRLVQKVVEQTRKNT